jgi:hypothetical protein
MKKGFLLLWMVLFLMQHVSGQENWVKLNKKPREVACYASGKIEKSYIPPPEYLVNRLKSGAGKTCDIVVTYINFPDTAKKAFDYAIGLWEQLIQSEVPIYLTAEWKSMDKKNTLANCGPSAYYRNLDGLYFADRFYPVAIAEKLAGEELTGSSSPDITANFNSTVEWYFGTDGNCPNNAFDFVTTVLHEVTHGLGFVGFFYVDEAGGTYYEPPVVFDHYVANYARKFLTDTFLFPNPSQALLKEFTSNALYFRSPATLFDGAGTPPRLYAPGVWDEGSSIYHLNEATYGIGDPNSLMTPFTGYGQVIHDPGPITMSILADIGWKNILFVHQQVKDIESVTDPVHIEASVTSDYALDTASLLVYYSVDSFATYDSLFMVSSGSESLFITELAVPVSQGEISYYLSAADEKERVFTFPPGAPDSTLTFRVGPDFTPPTIHHESIEFILSRADNLAVTAVVDDNIGVDSVWVEYLHNDTYVGAVGMKNDSASVYSAVLKVSSLDLMENDTLRYRIVARDQSVNQNITSLPETGYYAIIVEEIYQSLTSYSNDFNNLETKDFIHSNFAIRDYKLFSDGALHTLHPYQSPEQDDRYYNYTSQLKHPIVLLEGGEMYYDEIVLVEPGEKGTIFGDPEFWDYVIVEGSKDRGNEWLPLVDGYDSRSKPSWEIEYNNGINNQGNSITIGRKEMFFRKSIDLLEKKSFSAGDTILIRFRLFSDPYANGWGWIIDNLRIQTNVTAGELTNISPGEFIIYPNPAVNEVTVVLRTNIHKATMNLCLYNMMGELITCVPVEDYNYGFRKNLSLEKLPPGMYMVRVSDGKQYLFSGKILKRK